MADAQKIHRLMPLGFILTFAIFLKIPSLFEPNHYGDEGIYQTIGQALSRGALLYRDIWDNKPPLLYLVYSFFDGEQFLVRLFSLIVGILTIVVFYLLAQEVLKRPKITLVATALFALLTSLPLLEGNIANAENFMLFPIILAFYLTLKNFPKIKNASIFTSGALLGLAFLFKIVAVFDLGALLLFIAFRFWRQKYTLAKSSIMTLVGFALPIAVAVLFFLWQGILGDFLSAAFSQNVSYVSWGNKLFVAQGVLISKLFLLALFCFFIFLKNKSLEKEQVLVFLWWGFSLFNAFFAARPWIHYLLVLTPSFALLFGLFWQKPRLRVYTLSLVALTIYLALTQFWIYKQTFQYYSNFFSFVWGKKSLEDYRSFWGSHVETDYRVAQFLTLHSASYEPVFIWGNDAQIYALAKKRPASRYTVAYHIGFSPSAEKETLQSLITTKPRYFIILLPQAESLRSLEIFLLANYNFLFSEEGFSVYEKKL